MASPRGAYANAYPSSRVSGRVSLDGLQPTSIRASGSLPTDLLLSLLLSKSLLSLSLYVGRHWLLAQGYTPWSLTAIVLAVGAGGLQLWDRLGDTQQLAKRREEPRSPFYAIIFAAEVALAFLALSKLSVLRFMALTSFSQLWTRGAPFLSSAVGKRGLGKTNAAFMTGAMLGGSYLLDSFVSFQVSRRGYVYLLAHLMLCGQRTEMLSLYAPASVGRVHASGAVFAAIFSAVAAVGRYIFFAPAATAAVTHKTTSAGAFTAPEPGLSLLLPGAALLALTMILVDPLLSRALLAHFPPAKQIHRGWPVAMLSTLFVGFVGFGQGGSLAEAGVAAIAWTGISHLVSSDPRGSMVASSSSAVATSAANTPLLSNLSEFYRHLRSTIKTILATPDSRKIYFFLCLNLAFMFVQMAYGVWTNSLGLISDSIHMFFDCAALGMGLFASVMATWEANNKFTYGYSRVETLSGFANGLFLCLISIFIVFEAIQRLLDPPEMNTSQLLVVSSLGLAVNLVGMFATGHNHHGHSHGGGGGHASHSAPPAASHASHASHDDHNGHSHASHAGHDDHSGHDHAGHGGHGEDEEDDDHSGHDHAGGGSHNMKGVFLHVMADTLGSVGVIISTLLIDRYGWTGFDPLASIFIAVLIFASVVPLVVDSGRLLVLDMGEERESEVRSALLALKTVEGLNSYSTPRFWSKDPATMIGSIVVHLAPSPASHDPSRPESSHHPLIYHNADKVTARVRKLLKSKIGGLAELTIEVTGS